ncbi:MAG: tRNA threonylcarbamoyladenosine dehydratase, partial [Azovibrio sp.]
IITNKMDLIIDAIDQVRAKAAMINHCRQLNIPIVITGAAGGKTDPTRICSDDLSRTTQDPLLARVRTLLRKEYGFPRPPKKMGVTAIYSTEPITRAPQECSSDTASNTTGNSPGSSTSNTPQSGGLNCAGFGSSVCVTAPMGFAAVAAGLKMLRP